MISIPFHLQILGLLLIFWPFTIIILITSLIACYINKDNSKFCEVMMYLLIWILIIFIAIVYVINH